MSCLAQKSSGITFEHITRGDVNSVRRDLQKIRTGKIRSSAVHVTNHGNNSDGDY